MIDETKVAIIESGCFDYPTVQSLYRPSVNYPEYALGDLTDNNRVYESVRNAFRLLEYDAENYGTSRWNPLKEFVSTGDIVLIKPNLVMDRNLNKEGGTDCLFTHPAVVAAVIDYVLLALAGSGKVIVGDAPMQECDFDNLLEISGYKKMIEYYQKRGLAVEIWDFRGLQSTVKDGIHYANIDQTASGTIVDLGSASSFDGTDEKEIGHMRITNYDPRILQEHHNKVKHEYYISNYILDADVIINMPKPKSHRKAGATISLKNLVGANTRKEFLPHHTMGAKQQAGDEYNRISIIHALRSHFIDKKNTAQADKKYRIAKIYRFLIRVGDKMVKVSHSQYSEGSWYGNDTISRTITDLNKIVKYANKDGVMNDTPQRKMLIVADMIISGEKEGPVEPSPKKVGIIAAGSNPVIFDEAIVNLMGFAIKKIPTIRRARYIDNQYNLVSDSQFYTIVSNNAKYSNMTENSFKYDDSLKFIPTSGWINHIENK